MQNDKPAQATLTEMKNKIGDVLAMADEYEEVILTSYNKPKYKLIRIRSYIEEDKFVPLAEGQDQQNISSAATDTKDIVVVSERDTLPATPGVNIGDWHRNSDLEKIWVQKALNAN